ncbi:MAG: ABC transporter substrate-binding protein [Spirochaetaceae bacterium]
MKRILLVLWTICFGIFSVMASGQDEKGPVAQQVTDEKIELEGTITVNMPSKLGAKEAWQAVADSYMERHPKVNVIVELKPEEGYGDWVKTQFSDSNPSADLIGINYAHAYKGDKAINFMEYANLDSPYSGDRWTDQFNFQMQQKDLATNEWDNISLESVQVLWAYNKDIFSEVGVKPPKTWNEFVKVCKKIEEAGYQALAVAGDFNSFYAGQMGWLTQVYTDQTSRTLLEKFRSQPGDYNYDPDMDGAFKLNINDPFNDDPWKVNVNKVRAMNTIINGEFRGDSEGMKTVLSELKRVFPVYAGEESFFGTKDAAPLFYQAKAAILLDGAWRIPLFKNDMDKMALGEDIVSGETTIEGVQKFELGTFNMPSMEGPGIEAPARTIEVALGFIGAIKKEKVHDDLVADFLMYYSSSFGFSDYMSAGLESGWVPAGPSLVKGVELPAEYGAMFENLDFIGNVQKGFGQAIARGVPGDVQESLREWYSYTQDYFTNKIDVDQWGAFHQKNLETHIDASLQAQKIGRNDLLNPQNTPAGI